MSTGTSMSAKETKAQRAERLKLEKNPWECFKRSGSLPPKGCRLFQTLG